MAAFPTSAHQLTPDYALRYNATVGYYVVRSWDVDTESPTATSYSWASNHSGISAGTTHFGKVSVEKKKFKPMRRQFIEPEFYSKKRRGFILKEHSRELLGITSCAPSVPNKKYGKTPYKQKRRNWVHKMRESLWKKS